MRFHGDSVHEFIESVTVANVRALRPGQGQYTLLTNENGGIIDDLIVTKRPDHIYAVCNAGCADKDICHFHEAIEAFQANGGASVEMEIVEDASLIALQGPLAARTLQDLIDHDFSTWGFFQSHEVEVAGIPCLVTRSGYTGEDGFEVSTVLCVSWSV